MFRSADSNELPTSDSDEESSLLEEEHDMNLAMGVDTRNRSGKKVRTSDEAENFKERYVRFKKTTGTDKFIELLSKSANDEQSIAKATLDLQSRQLACSSDCKLQISVIQ